jgi:hypothetical protein
MINSFLQKKIAIALEKVSSEKYKSYILKQALFLNSLNIDNEKDLLKFHYVVQYIPSITKKVLGSYNKEICSKVSNEVFTNFKKIKSYDDLKNIIYNYLKSGLIKKAFPNDMGDNEKIVNYDINKWRSAINDIHIRSKIFGNKRDAIDFVTKDWRNMDEKLAFERWLKFYEDKGHTKYKMAQHITTDNIAFPVKLPYIPGLTKQENKVELANERDYELDEKNRSILNNTKGKLLGRIDSAIRILHSNTGMDFAGKEYGKLVDTLLSLKGDIMKIKSSLMLEDIICRAEGSLANSSSNIKQLFVKIAQLPPLTTEEPKDSSNEPVEQEAPKGDDGQKAIEEFVENSVSNTFKTIKEQYKDDLLELEQKNKFAWYDVNTPEFSHFTKVCDKLDKIIKSAKSFNSITVTAQETPTPVPAPIPEDVEAPEELEAQPKEPETLEDKLQEKKPEKESPFVDVTDSIEDALDNIKLSDVIKQLQALSRVFKNREIARQLSIIDLMLNKLGISGFFPALAEATRSALESNQYCQTRVEEILSKLVSATDEEGLSDFDVQQPKENAPKDDNMIDKEMKQYLEEPKKIETKQPKPEAAPMAPAAPEIAPTPPAKEQINPV